MKQLVFCFTLFLIGLAVQSSLVSCKGYAPHNAVTSDTETPTQLGDGVKDNLAWVMQDSVCEQVCWRNIILGETQVDELISTLEGDRNVTIIDNFSDLGLVEWKYGNGIEVIGELSRERGNSSVQQLVIRIPQYFTLSEATHYLGEPSHVLIIRDEGEHTSPTVADIFYRVYFVYLTRGIALEYVRAQPVDEASIGPNSLIGDVIMINSGLEDLKMFAKFDDSTQLVAWQGKNTLLYYCNLAYLDVENCR